MPRSPDRRRAAQFVPVLAILPFDTEEEALELTNQTEYRPTNCMQTGAREGTNGMVRALRTGMVESNPTYLCIETPFCGCKQSGNGRGGSLWGIGEYLEVTAVAELGQMVP